MVLSYKPIAINEIFNSRCSKTFFLLRMERSGVNCLLSGGKDSILALHVIEAMGLEVKHTTHLTPMNGVDEADSYMYQSAGSLIARTICEVSLSHIPTTIRQIKRPSKILTTEHFELDDEDEIMDLVEALSESQDCQFVGSGALFSDYQANRVRACANMFNQITIAPLWHIDQRFVLAFFSTHYPQFDVRIVKTATLGLGKGEIMSPLANIACNLLTLDKKFGVNVAGEGGEYETITLNAPSYRSSVIPQYAATEYREVATAAITGIAHVCNSSAGTLNRPVTVPFMHTFLREFPSVIDSLRLTMKGFTRPEPRAPTEGKIMDEFVGITPYIQTPTTSHAAVLSKRNELVLTGFYSLDLSMYGFVHCLVQIRNYVGYLCQHDFESCWSKMQLHATYPDSQNLSEKTLTTEMDNIMQEFSISNSSWRPDNGKCFEGCCMDGWISENNSYTAELKQQLMTATEFSPHWELLSVTKSNRWEIHIDPIILHADAVNNIWKMKRYS